MFYLFIIHPGDHDPHIMQTIDTPIKGIVTKF